MKTVRFSLLCLTTSPTLMAHDADTAVLTLTEVGRHWTGGAVYLVASILLCGLLAGVCNLRSRRSKKAGR